MSTRRKTSSYIRRFNDSYCGEEDGIVSLPKSLFGSCDGKSNQWPVAHHTDKTERGTATKHESSSLFIFVHLATRFTGTVCSERRRL